MADSLQVIGRLFGRRYHQRLFRIRWQRLGW